MMRFGAFDSGGYYGHGLTVNGRRYSAWFGPDGGLLAAERFNPDGSTRSVPARETGVRAALERIGRANRPAATN